MVEVCYPPRRCHRGHLRGLGAGEVKLSMRMDTISVPTKYEQSVAFRYTSSSTKMPNPDKNRATQRNAGIPTITRSLRFILSADSTKFGSRHIRYTLEAVEAYENSHFESVTVNWA